MLGAFVQWWKRPLDRRDRVSAVLIGALGGIWVGVFGRLLLGPMPVSVVALAGWASVGAVACAILGIIFPKAVRVLLYPLTFLGIGSN